MEEEMERANVQCLSDVVGLQRACQTENLRFSTETNKFLVYETLQKLGPSAAQKLISKLVDDGFIQWEEDKDYEVEDILDHADEDISVVKDHQPDEDVCVMVRVLGVFQGKRYYLIKWEGWSHFHNSWEPAENLHCPSVIADYLALYAKRRAKLPAKRSVPQVWESAQVAKRRKVDEIFHKLWCSPLSADLSPLQLLTLHGRSGGGGRRRVVHKGLVSSQDPSVRPTFRAAPNYSSKKRKVYRVKQGEIRAALQDWQRRLNAISTDPAPILVENDVDLEGPPENFEYINDYRAGDGIHIPQDPIIGCQCLNCFDEKKSCCGTACGSEFAYYRWKRLRVPRGTPIYECNKRCRCGPDCPNRVVQVGRKVKVCIFRTSNGRGWGVKTMQKIKKGTFVMEYVGEVITNEEAERRGKVYDAECRTYLFDLDYNDGDCPFTVDAGYAPKYQRLKTLIEDEYDKDVEVTGEGTPTTTGFLEVFVNGQLVHSKKNGDGYVDNKAKENKILDAIGQALADQGQDKDWIVMEESQRCMKGLAESTAVPGEALMVFCEPNLVVFGVWINTLDPRLPRICLFADRDIGKGEELTFDYMMTGDTTQSLSGHGNLSFTLPLSPGVELPELSQNGTEESGTEPDCPPSKGGTEPDCPPSKGDTEPDCPPSKGDTEPDCPPSKGDTEPDCPPSKGDTEPDCPPSKGDTEPDCPPSKGDTEPDCPPSKDGTEPDPLSTSPAKHSQEESPSPLTPRKSARSPVKVRAAESLSKGQTTPPCSPLKAPAVSEENAEKPPTKMKYRMICQCGSSKCRKYLF
ncbi:hypothetical protein ACOMHN_016423 [Nucella lapillus]